MTIGITPDEVELGRSLRSWASSIGGRETARAAEGRADESFAEVWAAVTDMGLHAIALPESVGGGGGSIVDQSTALEACAYGLVPGGLIGAVAAGLLLRGSEHASSIAVGNERTALAPRVILTENEGRLRGSADIIWDGPGAEHVLLCSDQGGYLVPASGVDQQPKLGLDLTRRASTATIDVALTEAIALPDLDPVRVRRTVVTLAAAEAAGVARWCLDMAASYAKVREQFGAPIGSFQAVKHLCAQMLETTEAATAAAWDAAAALDGDPVQADFAAEVAAVTALDGAVGVAQDCIQVLGGIGFTFEHDAHLYLRRAVALRTLVGGTSNASRQLTTLARAGVRRRIEVDLGGQDVEIRDEVRAQAAAIAALEPAEQRAALVEAGYVTPHWPAPYGLGADPVTQLVIDSELAAAACVVPDLGIAGWALPTILEHGSEAQRERFLRPTLLGELAWCQLFSEPGAGSDLASLRMKAVRDHVEGVDGWRLTGQKVWTSHARGSDWGICLARTDPEAPKHRGITYFLVDMTSPGLDIRPLREMTGDELFNEVFFDGVFVPDDCVVGEPGDGWRLTRTTLANERVAMGSYRLDVCVERAIALGQERDDESIGRVIALATVCAQLGLRTTLRSLAGQGPGAESTVAKLLGVRLRQTASELVVDLLGPRVALGGPEVEEAVHEMLLTRCLSIAGGTTQILRNVAAERILGLPR